jgi:hypothetical protein
MKPLSVRFLTLFAGLALVGLATGLLPLSAQSADAVPALSTEQRLADIEAYLNNTERPSGGASLIPGPGPGHNAWQMVSTALVIFMTLPGLALFYGGLVRKKNVLSVLAQCMGIAGLVTILWWAGMASTPAPPWEPTRLRPTAEVERQGLDQAEHGEEGYVGQAQSRFSIIL